MVVSCQDGIALVAENPSPSLHKIGEIYDKIAFAAVGKYNEFESLRQAGVRYADVRGYSYDREDVTPAGWPASTRRASAQCSRRNRNPSRWNWPWPRWAPTQDEDHLYRLTFDGSIADEHGFIVMGGQADKVSEAVAAGWQRALPFAGAIRLAWPAS